MNEGPWDANPESWTAIATAALFVATSGLWIFTGLMWWATREAVKDSAESLKLANAVFITAHRPSIVIRNLLMLFSRGASHPELRFDIYNKGDSDAKICAVEFLMFIDFGNRGHSPIIETHEPTLPITLRAGYNVPWSGYVDMDIDELLGEDYLLSGALGGPDITLDLRIKIIYLDDLERRRQSGFHRRFDFNEAQFFKVANSDDEFLD